MASFLSYNTDDATANQAAPTSGQVLTIGPIQTGVAHKVAGSVFMDVAGGTCVVQQSFDDGAHWDIADSISLTAGTGAKIDVDVIAPLLRVVFTNGGTSQGHLRIFVRVYGSDRSG